MLEADMRNLQVQIKKLKEGPENNDDFQEELIRFIKMYYRNKE